MRPFPPCGGRYCCGLLPLSSFARSSAPRFVAPALAAAFSVRSCFIASVSSERSFAFTERLIERFLRSTLMIIACTLSPSFRCLVRSSMRSRENSEARRYPSTPPMSTTAPLASTDLTVPCTTLFFSWLAMKLVNGSPSICFTPSEMRSRSTSIDSTTASSSSLFLKFLTASSPAVDQAFDSAFYLDECAIVGKVRHLAEQARALRIAPRDADPWVFTQLLEAKGHPVFLSVELQHLGGDFIADVQHLGRVLHTPPGEVGDMQQAV